MLTSISPLGERARGQRWGVTATAYVGGSLLGGLSIGAVLGAAGSGLPHPLLLAAALCAAALSLDLRAAPPTLRRQVDQAWLTRYRGWVYGFGYGYQLGLGVVTIVTSASTYAGLALALLSGSAATGAVIGGCFGLVRAVPLLALHGADTPTALHRTAAGLERLSATAGRVTVGVLGASVALLLVAG